MKRTTVEGKVEPRPRLDEVPVVFPYSGTKGITFPLEDGDPCLLVFSQRSIDDWVTLKLEAPVTDSRLHDINDAFCIPGPASPLSVIPLEEGFQINHDKIWIGNNESIPLVLSGLPNTELIQIVTKLLELLQTPLAVTGALANLNPVVAAQFTEMQSALGALTP